MAYVYQHIRKDKNNVFYIGIGSDKNYTRANNFKGRNEIWNNIHNKTEVFVEILFENITWTEACEVEKKLIFQYGRLNNNTGILANMTDGGEGTLNRVISEETRQKLGNGNRGKKRTEESKLKQSDSTKGLKKPESQSLKLKSFRTGKKWDENVKKKISEKKLGLSSWNKGLKFSEESREKMSLSKKIKNWGRKTIWLKR